MFWFKMELMMVVVVVICSFLFINVQSNQDVLMRLSHSTVGTTSSAAHKLLSLGELANDGGGVGNVAVQQTLKYDAPDDCRVHIDDNQDVSLACNLRTVNSEFDTTNFSVIPSEHTVSLIILCSDMIMTKSALKPRSFLHLTRLRELSMEFCKFVKFTGESLYGLVELRNLSIRTHNVNWPALSLEIEPDAFLFARNLERLDLSLNNIWSLPDSVFCPLTGLSFLNLSLNRLQDISDLGFREKVQSINDLTTNATNATTSSITSSTTTITSTTTTIRSSKSVSVKNCMLDIEQLDVSHNHFVLLPANGFGILKRLRHLSLHHNEISMVDDRALQGLRNLQMLDLSSNRIVALPSELFADSAQSIQEIYLQNNSISVLSPHLFSNLEQLHALDLATNKITSAWIDKDTFSGLIRLVLLNLSNNRITKLEPEIFSDLYTLQILNLRYNQLETIAADSFSPMNNLHTLLLSHNKIKYLDAYSLNGLYVLSLLSIDNNQLAGVHPEAFRNCSSLQDLNLNGNQLNTVPLALKDMRLLRTVDLGENQIAELNEQGFRGMTNLYGLRLIGNQLENISRTIFADLPSLQILNLAHNRIKFVEQRAFEMTANIQAIRLDGNQLTSMDGLFAQMPSLLWLNMSDNQLGQFDFADVPHRLLWLDLHKNELRELGNAYGLETKMSLQTLDVSFNRLHRVTASSVPNSIELLFFNDNLITTVEPHTFMHKPNLTRVDLYANQITSLDVKALRVLPVPEDKPLSEFYIGGNPFICDCNIDWLQKINQVCDVAACCMFDACS